MCGIAPTLNRDTHTTEQDIKRKAEKMTIETQVGRTYLASFKCVRQDHLSVSHSGTPERQKKHKVVLPNTGSDRIMEALDMMGWITPPWMTDQSIFILVKKFKQVGMVHQVHVFPLHCFVAFVGIFCIVMPTQSPSKWVTKSFSDNYIFTVYSLASSSASIQYSWANMPTVRMLTGWFLTPKLSYQSSSF